MPVTTLDDVIPRVLPASWQQVAFSGVPGGAAFQSVFGLYVIVSVEDRGTETGWWHHISLSRRNKLPSWADVREVKDLHRARPLRAPFTLHLWSRLDAPTVPPRLYEDM